MATHYFPGETITLSDGGVFLAFDNYAVSGLPNDGNDPNRVGFTGGYSGYRAANSVAFNFVGDGKSVDIEVTPLGTESGYHNQGQSTMLYQNDGSPGAPNWIPAQNPVNFASATNIPGLVRQLTVAGKQYYLEVGTLAYSNDVEAERGHGKGFDQKFNMTVKHAPDPTNDHRADAFDIVIPEDGATYQSDPTSYQGFLHEFNSGNDDPPPYFTTIFYTAWWKYVPTKDTDLVIHWQIIPIFPEWYQIFSIRVHKLLDDGTLQRLAWQLDTRNDTFTVTGLHADDIIYVDMGVRADSTNIALQGGFAQKYQFSATGAKSKAQIFTDGGDPPVNDLRKNATKINIQDDGDSWVSVDTPIKYATRSLADDWQQTVWWKYTPITGDTKASGYSPTGRAKINTFAYHYQKLIEPLPDHFRFRVIDSSKSDAVIIDAKLNIPFEFSVTKGHTYYIVMGTEGSPITTPDWKFYLTFEGASTGYDNPIDGPKKNPVKKNQDHGDTTGLKLIRDFSLSIGRPVRITGPNTIEIVEASEGLPTGFGAGDADDMYVQDKTQLKAYVGTKNTEMNYAAACEDNDIRIIMSDWRMPQKLPVEGYVPANVQSYNWTATPLGFKSNVAHFFPPDVPYEALETE